MLKIIYFINNKGKTKEIPVKEYVDNIFDQADVLKKKGKIAQFKKMWKLGIRILALIEHTARNNGIVTMPQGKKLHNYPFWELRQKVSKKLVRIFYFVHFENDLVLLHAYDKPEETSAPVKELKKAAENYILYKSNPHKHAFF
jgi:hypothetical protein